MSICEAAKYDIDFRLRQKEGEFQQAALLANGVKIEALADDGVVVPGQTVKVNVIVANHGAAEIAIKQVGFTGFQSNASCVTTAFTPSFFFPGAGRGRGSNAPPEPAMPSVKKDQVAHCEPELTIPASARVNEPYWHRRGEEGRYTFDADAPFGLPMRPTPFYVQVSLAMGGQEVISGLPVQHRYEGNIFSGEKRTELLVVPALSVRMTPQIAIVPAASIRATPVPTTGATAARPKGRALQPPPKDAVQPPPVRRPRPSGRAESSGRAEPSDAPTSDREVRVTVVNDTNGAVESVVKLEAPPGWSVTPQQRPVKFARGDESLTVRFQVKPGAGTGPGEYHVRAVVTSGGQTFDRGYEVVEYPHIRRYH